MRSIHPALAAKLHPSLQERKSKTPQHNLHLFIQDRQTTQPHQKVSETKRKKVRQRKNTSQTKRHAIDVRLKSFVSPAVAKSPCRYIVSEFNKRPKDPFPNTQTFAYICTRPETQISSPTQMTRQTDNTHRNPTCAHTRTQ